jgi:thioredoxin 1
MTHPTIFASLDFEAALEEARSNGKLLLVDATASWCGPCQIMDRTTWVDRDVMETTARTALVIQVDVDAQPEVKNRLRIQAMPTVVAFRDGAELDRVVGLQRPDQLLRWLEGLGRGETSTDRTRAEIAANPHDMKARMSLARSMMHAGRFEDATTEYLWLWEHMLEHEPAMVGVRHSFLVRELQQVVSEHAPARDAFARLREVAAPPAAGQPNHATLMDWFSLNDILGEASAGLVWFDAAREHLQLDDRLAKLLETRIAPMLIQAGRWADVGSLYPRPLATLASAAAILVQSGMQLPAGAPPGMAEQFKAYAVTNLRDTAQQVARALTAAGRLEEAVAVRVEAQRLDASPEMSTALKAVE